MVEGNRIGYAEKVQVHWVGFVDRKKYMGHVGLYNHVDQEVQREAAEDVHGGLGYRKGKPVDGRRGLEAKKGGVGAGGAELVAEGPAEGVPLEVEGGKVRRTHCLFDRMDYGGVVAYDDGYELFENGSVIEQSANVQGSLVLGVAAVGYASALFAKRVLRASPICLQGLLCGDGRPSRRGLLYPPSRCQGLRTRGECV